MKVLRNAATCILVLLASFSGRTADLLLTHPPVFDNGAEFPGANGHSEVADGELRLAYDFSGGGHYVRAAVSLPERPTVGAVRFEANFDHTTQLAFRFTDATGQVFQQLLRGTTEGWSGWTVSLGNVSTHWGGKNDGVVHQPIAQIAFLAENLTSARGGPKGVLSVRNVRLEESVPVPAVWSSERPIGELTAEVEALKAKLQVPAERGSAKARATRAVLEVFRPWVERDIAKGWTERAKRELLEMRRIAADELARLDRVDRGEETDAPVPRFVTSPVETRGADLVADRVWPDGRRERGRVFLNGFGHFRQAQDAVGRFQELGNGYLQMEIGPWDILKDENTVDLAVLDRFRAVADNCASNNVKICLLVSPHYFPKWALEKWPDLKDCGWGFFKYCVHDERAWGVLEKYLRILIPQVKDHPALHSICLSNEPVQAQWGSNCVLRAEWKGPVMESCWNPEPTRETLDFCRFNRGKFGSFHRRLAALVRELAPGLPVHAKIMVWQEFENGPTYHSVDLREFSELSDLNGNDAEDYPFPDGDGIWAHRWWDMEAGYDWQRSSRDAPVLNSENHIIPDHFRAYVPGNHLYTVLWQNTLHGQAATALWMWERTYDPKSMANGLVLERPECLNAWAHCALDVSRLADALSPIRNQKPTILLHWSLASQILSGRRGHYFLACYRAAAFLGQPLGVVTDETLGAFGRDGRLVRPLEEARVVLLPDFGNLEPETLAGLRRLADRGVKVWRCEGGERALFRRMCEEMGSWGLPDLPRVREPGSERGVFGVESRGCRVDGKSYLSIVNHTTGPLRVRLESAGRDLITGAKVPQEFDLRPMTPMFVECEPQPSARVKYLDEFDLSSMSCGMGVRPQARKTILEKPLRIGERTFGRGVGTHSESIMLFRANGKVKAFDAVVGVDRETQDYPDSWRTRKNYGSCSFRVYADWRKVCDSGVLKEKDPPKAIHADLAGATNILIECTDGGHWAGYMCGHGDWADARFTLDDGAEIAPVADDPRLGQLGILTPPIPDAPRINGPAVWGVRPGHPVIYRVPVSGKRPMKLSVAGLPDGATFDPEKGIIGGRVASAGDYVCRITAENASGRAERDFTLKVGEAISLTPPMGWNSWNIYSKRVTDAKVRAIARAMDETGLADHGWAYVNVDDWWMKNPDAAKDNPAHAGPVRDGEGRFVPQAAFPDMKALGDYIHSLGFRFGIYSSPGAKTCGGCEGSLGHEEIDARTWADWGVDYLKHDWCSYWDVFNAETKGRKPEIDDYAKPYRLMSKCLRAQDRDIVHAFCQYGIGDVQTWGREAGAQVWRSWGDLKDNWTSILNSIDSYAEAWKHTGPGFWCDPDMMVIGRLGDFGGHDSFLSHNEQYTHMSLWCLLNAPLLLGCDLTRLDDFTKGLVINDEVLAVSQDTLGRQAQRVRRTDDTEIWWRPLADGSSATGLVNRYPFARTVEFRFMEAGQSGEFWVKDLWRQRCLGRHRDSITVEVPGHATVLLKMVRGDCVPCEERRESGQFDRAEMNRPEGYCAVQGAGGSVKVLFLGNSTALHGPKPEIGWTNNWGMAASAPEKDYVHLTTRGIERHLGVKAEMRVRNVYGFECGYRTWDVEANLKEEIAFRPDYLILGFGGNAKDLDKPENAAVWGTAIDRLINSFTRADGTRPVVVVVGGFWPKEELDGTLRAAAKRHAAPFVKSDFAGEPGMYAKGLFWHKGVEGHPGDRGMAERAHRILSALFPEDGGQQKEGR